MDRFVSFDSGYQMLHGAILVLNILKRTLKTRINESVKINIHTGLICVVIYTQGVGNKNPTFDSPLSQRAQPCKDDSCHSRSLLFQSLTYAMIFPTLGVRERYQHLVQSRLKLCHALADHCLAESGFKEQTAPLAVEPRALHESIAIMSKTISELETANPSLVARPQNPRKMMMDLRGIATHSKQFEPSDTAEELWAIFDHTCSTHYLSDWESIHLLRLLIVEHEIARMWFTNQIAPRLEDIGSSISLIQVKESFYNQFLPAGWKGAKFVELIQVRFQKTDTVRAFCNRIAFKMKEVLLDVKSKDDAVKYLRLALFCKCPPLVCRMIGTKSPTDFESCQDLIDELVKFPGVPDDIPAFKVTCNECGEPIECPNCSDNDTSEQNVASSSMVFAPPKKRSLNWRRNRARKNRKYEVSIASRNSPADLKWCRFGCGQRYTPGHDCPSFKKQKKTSKPVINSIQIHGALLTHLRGNNSSFQTKSLKSAFDHSLSSNCH